ncbi:MAG: PilZ domain-containing protein [Myxococcales bacterium]|nr:PilZ domain-containing protein [Myxococcales bacterium]
MSTTYEDDSEERRRAERFPINYEFSSLAPGSVIFVSNISETGAFIQSRQRLPIGTALELRFTVLLDDPVVISASGRVVYHGDDPRGMGVEFTDVTPEMALRLADVVSQARAAAADESQQALRIRELSQDELAQLEDDDDDDDDDDASLSSMSLSASMTAELSMSQLEEVATPEYEELTEDEPEEEEPEYEDF